MLTKRIIPCLDVKNGKTVKGVNFENLRDAGDPVELGKRYAEQGADELVFLDITATLEKRALLLELVRRVAKEINIPFTVGGGIDSVADVAALLSAGADKISLNSAAIKQPELITRLAAEFGSQCVVVAIDAKQDETGHWQVYIHSGKTPVHREAVEWAQEVESRGAGEILLTSMNNDGSKTGFAVELTRRISETVSIPIVASGGAGEMEHFSDVFARGKADAALAASIFHYDEISIPKLKNYLRKANFPIR